MMIREDAIIQEKEIDLIVPPEMLLPIQLGADKVLFQFLGAFTLGELTVAVEVEQERSLQRACLVTNEGAGVLDLPILLIHEGADEKELPVPPAGLCHLGRDESLELAPDRHRIVRGKGD